MTADVPGYIQNVKEKHMELYMFSIVNLLIFVIIFHYFQIK